MIRKDIPEDAGACYQPPIVTLQCYGKEKSFGEYHVETSRLIITNASMMDIELEKLMEYLRNNDNLGSYILFGVPKEVYELSEKFRYEGNR
jgi:hypothetical protein